MVPPKTAAECQRKQVESLKAEVKYGEYKKEGALKQNQSTKLKTKDEY